MGETGYNPITEASMTNVRPLPADSGRGAVPASEIPAARRITRITSSPTLETAPTQLDVTAARTERATPAEIVEKIRYTLNFPAISKLDSAVGSINTVQNRLVNVASSLEATPDDAMLQKEFGLLRTEIENRKKETRLVQLQAEAMSQLPEIRASLKIILDADPELDTPAIATMLEKLNLDMLVPRIHAVLDPGSDLHKQLVSKFNEQIGHAETLISTAEQILNEEGRWKIPADPVMLHMIQEEIDRPEVTPAPPTRLPRQRPRSSANDVAQISL